MTSKVREILSWYGSDSPGTLTNLARLLNAGYLGGTGKLVILPVDQGFEHGPFRSFAKNPEAYDPSYHFKLAVESGCSAYAAPLGFLEGGVREHVGDIPLILKANNSDSLFKDKKAPESYLTSSVDHALRLGCVGVGFTIYPGSERPKYEAIAKASEEAKKRGLIVVIWSYPRGGNLSSAGETGIDVVAYAAHIAAQLGAHIIKVKPPTEHIEKEENKKAIKENGVDTDSLESRTRHILKATFHGKRLVVFSGGASKSTKELLDEIKSLAKGGASGSIVGRNSFQRPRKEALKLLKEIMDIYKKA